MDLSIIIVNYNVKEFLENSLQSILKATRRISSEIIVVDNASDDGSIDLIKNKFPDVQLIENKENLGFSRANNIALNIARGKYLLLLNPDTIVEEDTFETMIKFFDENKEVGLAGCKIINPDGTLQAGCRRSFPGPWNSFCKVTGLSSLFPKSRIFARYNLTYLDENHTHEVDAISGSFMFLKSEVYKRIGGLDEDFFMYGEDLDWCFRVQQAGYKVFYVHSTQIIHYKGESTKRSSIDEIRHFYNAMHLFVKKHISSSFVVEAILRIAIMMREIVAFLGRDRIVIISILIDLVLFNLSLLVSEKFYLSITTWGGFNPDSLMIIFTIPAIIQIIVGILTHNYRREGVSVLSNFTSVIIGFFVISASTFFFKDYAYSRFVVIISYIVFFLFSAIWRVFYKIFIKDGGIKKARIRTLIVGTSFTEIEIAEKLRAKKTTLYSVIGLIAKTRKGIGERISGYEVIGSIDNIRKLIYEKKINEVIFSSKELSYKEIMKIVSNCQKENVEFKLAGDSLEFLVGKSSVNLLTDLPVVEISYKIAEPVNKILKRSLDLVVSFVLLPIYPIFYLLRKKRDSGFANLVKSAPAIFVGKLSLVGPEELTDANDLFLGKRGITGLWYIEESVDKEKINMFYAKNQTIWLDLEIIGKTILKTMSE
ncbi:MAG: glycosyltransferase [Ignavibacteriaceae bacterium]